MGRAKVVNYYNNRYKGSLDDDTCNILEQLIDLDKDNGCVTDLIHVIYELDDTTVDTIIEEMEYYGSVVSEVNKRMGTLRDMQTIGVAFLYWAKSCILGDSAGTGKTTQAAGLCNLLKMDYAKANKQFRFLLLTEKNLVYQCRAEMIKYTGDYVYTLSGEKPDNLKFSAGHPCGVDFSVVGSHSLFNQSIFFEWLENCRLYGDGFPFDILIVDESSALGNSTTGITKNAKQLIKYFDRIVFLNATPFEKALSTFYTQLDLVDGKLLPTKTNFEKEYVVYNYSGMFPKPTGNYKNQDDFKHKVGYRYFARTRKDKGAKMEDCSGGVKISSLSTVQKELLEKTYMHQQVFDCPNAIDPSIPFTSEFVPKLESLYDVITNDCEDASTILLYVHFRQAQDSISEWLNDLGYSNRILCGDTKDKERNDIIRGFKNGEFRVLITNVQKGLNFGDCNYCIFYGFNPNPNKMVQFEGRITRGFDIINKHVYVLCSKGKEEARLNKVVKLRAKESSKFTQADISCILSILLDD